MCPTHKKPVAGICAHSPVHEPTVRDKLPTLKFLSLIEDGGWEQHCAQQHPAAAPTTTQLLLAQM